MNSSYKNNLSYKDIFSTLCFIKNPHFIVEFGILDGYSLKQIIEYTGDNCKIHAYDIFDEFHGNSANKQDLINKFSKHKNVLIDYGDFYKKFNEIDDNSIDILHVDIANNGDVVEFVFNNYIDKVKKDGIIILEGGSKERDCIEWMNKYNKPKMKPVLKKYSKDYDMLTIGNIPSITVIKIK
tara:strand:+ start:9173 stop:9718 length:546 start_codon:yes stop_codon:yes gene_type:complete